MRTLSFNMLHIQTFNICSVVFTPFNQERVLIPRCDSVVQMTEYGFGHFKGVDGSEAMLEEAKTTGLYEDLRQLILGQVPLPAHWGKIMLNLLIHAICHHISPCKWTAII